MRKLAIAISAAVFTLATAAAAPLQCTNPDILNGLVFLGRSETKMIVTPGSPGFMGDFRAPAGFSLIGTGVRPFGQSVVAYKSALAGGKAFEALIAALGAEGWAVEATADAGSTFNVAGSPRYTTVCRNGDRRNVLVAETAGVTYVSLLSSLGGRHRDCNSPDPATTRVFGLERNALRLFQFPAGTSLAQGGGGGGGSNTVYTTSLRVISTATPAGLVAHLASQMEAKGWRADAQWIGAENAGSTWRKIDDGQPTTGVVRIVRVSEGTYDVDFTTISAE